MKDITTREATPKNLVDGKVAGGEGGSGWLTRLHLWLENRRSKMLARIGTTRSKYSSTVVSPSNPTSKHGERRMLMLPSALNTRPHSNSGSAIHD
ncbi:hypothetical protein MA16_Dca002098 [Dendrobium catenatum]|uniref:Uncharacterized protein n=1 Tax=Dendrobium catenatum TaxID=906689 RepID=A0A2I0XEB8_9ASPA|nr:hypothetical protein MA16_Dca002098 [Dendrobium catenatum]